MIDQVYFIQWCIECNMNMIKLKKEEDEGKINKQTADKSETTRPQKRIASTSNEIAVRSETDER